MTVFWVLELPPMEHRRVVAGRTVMVSLQIRDFYTKGMVASSARGAALVGWWRVDIHRWIANIRVFDNLYFNLSREVPRVQQTQINKTKLKHFLISLIVSTALRIRQDLVCSSV